MWGASYFFLSTGYHITLLRGACPLKNTIHGKDTHMLVAGKIIIYLFAQNVLPLQ